MEDRDLSLNTLTYIAEVLRDKLDTVCANRKYEEQYYEPGEYDEMLADLTFAISEVSRVIQARARRLAG